MSQQLLCWRCGASLEALSLPLLRLEECAACRAQLHVCRMCVAWDPQRPPRRCREDDAEEVRTKDQANFCDYFRPSPAAFDAAVAAAEQQARHRLDALFGSGEPPAASGDAAADDLFRR